MWRKVLVCIFLGLQLATHSDKDAHIRCIKVALSTTSAQLINVLSLAQVRRECNDSLTHLITVVFVRSNRSESTLGEPEFVCMQRREREIKQQNFQFSIHFISFLFSLRRACVKSECCDSSPKLQKRLVSKRRADCASERVKKNAQRRRNVGR